MEKNVYEFISKQTNDPIVEWRTCAVSGTEFPIFQSDLVYYEKISPTLEGKKYLLPAPTLCPEERERRRLSWRNERKLYRRNCDKTGKSMMSMYPENSEYTIYDWKVWYSDARDAMDYGRDYDFSKTFVENYEALNRAVPKKSLHIVDSMENCEYCNYGIFSKSCYLVNGWGRAENCLYSTIPARSTYDVDGLYNMACQQTYQCVHCIWCFECTNCDHSNMCKFSSFLSFCNNCDYCLGCVNLQTARHCILNKQYTKEEYETLAKEILKDRNSRADFQKKFEALFLAAPRKNLNNVWAESCFSNYVQNGKNNILCTFPLEAADNRYSTFTGITKGPIYDGYATTNSWFTHETCWMDGVNSAFILTGECGTNDCYYCQHVNDCNFCFGCTAIKHKKYCILNKQYSKEEYEKLVGQIITKMEKAGERGENFPVKNSTFGYNETVAQTFHPLTKEEALARWYKRQDLEYAINIPEWLEKIQGKDLPVSIDDVTDEIIDKVILCEKTGKPYRVIKQELDFYRKHHLPLPTKHQDVRKEELMRKRMPKEFHISPCSHCGEEMLSAYGPDSGYNVRCEKCYTKEIYW